MALHPDTETSDASLDRLPQSKTTLRNAAVLPEQVGEAEAMGRWGWTDDRAGSGATDLRSRSHPVMSQDGQVYGAAAARPSLDPRSAHPW